MLRLFKPECFAPYHGEYRMLKIHGDLANECGILKKNIFILENGQVLSLTKNNVKKQGRINAGEVYVDGSRIGDVGSVIIKDRKLMSKNGFLSLIINLDTNSKTLLNLPAITTRGYILVNENEELIKEIQKISETIINRDLKKKNFNFNDLKNNLINELVPTLAKRTGRVPIILPIIMNIKNNNNTKNTEI